MNTDPIADLLTRIRNASRARHEEVQAPASRLKLAIVRVLYEEGYIAGYQFHKDRAQGMIRITLKYTGRRREPVIRGIERVSKPGRRLYVGKRNIPRVEGGIGTAILTTPRGVLTDREALRLGVGGEVICKVW